jgi:hypothetical protein
MPNGTLFNQRTLRGLHPFGLKTDGGANQNATSQNDTKPERQNLIADIADKRGLLHAQVTIQRRSSHRFLL